MRDCGELMLYIEAFEFSDKQDLKKQLEDCLLSSEDERVKKSIKTALDTLAMLSEEELKEIKGNIR